ncbi:hypothetical protein ABT010_34570 [Streptomyces sp. NPDC002668]|uniref:hypothetical protein n=1 Tax=Streptomyces sp. NPDC002668 TaxID=3154422 RepID=UPI003325B5A0
MDATDPGRVRQLGQGVLQRDGLPVAGVAVQAYDRPDRGRVRDPPQHRPHGGRVDHLRARHQDRDPRQVLLLPQEHLPSGTPIGHHVQAQLTEQIQPARPGHLRLPPGQQSPPRPPVPAPTTSGH